MCTANPEKSRMIYAINTFLLSCLKPPPYRTIHLEGLRRNAPFQCWVCEVSDYWVRSAPAELYYHTPLSHFLLHQCTWQESKRQRTMQSGVAALSMTPAGRVTFSSHRRQPLLTADGGSHQDTFTQFWVPEHIIRFQIRIELHWSIYV